MEEINEFKTPYDWCVEVNIRVLDINEWPDLKFGSSEKCYFEMEYNKTDFFAALSKVKVKPNSNPRKTAPYLEYRMYGLVPYNISSIQGAIQYGHALQEFNNMMMDEYVLDTHLEYVLSSNQELIIAFNKWRKEDKTFIILNGGTTNKNDNNLGSLNIHATTLYSMGVKYTTFYEPDLGDQLTAVVFLVDERVFNRETYPNYVDTPYPWKDKGRGYRPTDAEVDKWEAVNIKNRDKWVEKIGGPKNEFLRTWLKDFRFAD